MNSSILVHCLWAGIFELVTRRIAELQQTIEGLLSQTLARIDEGTDESTALLRRALKYGHTYPYRRSPWLCYGARPASPQNSTTICLTSRFMHSHS